MCLIREDAHCPLIGGEGVHVQNFIRLSVHYNHIVDSVMVPALIFLYLNYKLELSNCTWDIKKLELKK